MADNKHQKPSQRTIANQKASTIDRQKASTTNKKKTSIKILQKTNSPKDRKRKNLIYSFLFLLSSYIIFSTS